MSVAEEAGLAEFLGALAAMDGLAPARKRAAALQLALSYWDLQLDEASATAVLRPLLPDPLAARWLLGIAINAGSVSHLGAAIASLRAACPAIEDDLREAESLRIVAVSRTSELIDEASRLQTEVFRKDYEAVTIDVCARTADTSQVLASRGRIDAVYWAQLLDLGIEAACALNDKRLTVLLERRAALLDGDASSLGEAQALRYLAAMQTYWRGPSSLARERLAPMKDGAPAFASALLTWTRLLMAAAAEAWRDVGLAHAELTESASGRGVAHALRAASLLAHEGDADISAHMRQLAGGVLDAVPSQTAHEDRARTMLSQEPDGPRRAAAIVESCLGDPVRARSMLADRTARFGRKDADAWVRLTRRVAIADIGDAYEVAARRDLGAAPMYQNAAGIWYWHNGQRADAERCFVAAGDAIAQMALTHLRGGTREVSGARAPHVARREPESPQAAMARMLETLRVNAGQREHFTALESLGYEHGAWDVLREQYQLAIDACELGSDAYRLSDLYHRLALVYRDGQPQPILAAAACANVIAFEPGHREAEEIVARWQAMKPSARAACMEFETLVKRAESRGARAGYLRAAAVMALRAKSQPDAVRLMTAILEVAPRDRWSFEGLDRHYAQSGDAAQRTRLVQARLATTSDVQEQAVLQHRLAHVSEELRDDEEAIAHYQALLRTDPRHRGALDALARIYEATERWRELVDVTEKQTTVVQEPILRGMLLFRAGSVLESKLQDRETAYLRYDEAVRVSPSCLPAVHGLRELAQQRGEWHRVLDTLGLEAEQWGTPPERASVYVQMAQLCEQRLFDPERAETYLQKALDVHKESVPARMACFRRAMQRGEWALAMTHAPVLAHRLARQGEPTVRSEFFWQRGMAFVELEQLSDAVESIVLALEIRPANLEALRALVALGRDEPHAFDYGRVFRDLERIYRQRGEADDAPLLVHVGLAQAALFDGELDAAELQLSALCSQANTSAQRLAVTASLARLLTLSGRVAQAHAAWSALSTNPTFSAAEQAQIAIARADLALEAEPDADLAMQQVQRALGLTPLDAALMLREAGLCFLRGEFAKASAAAEAGARLLAQSADPCQRIQRRADALCIMGAAQAALGATEASRLAYETALAADPCHVTAAIWVARQRLAANDRPGAEAILYDAGARAARLRSPKLAALLQRELARIATSAGDMEAAINAYRGILHARPHAIEDRLALAELYALTNSEAASNEAVRVIHWDNQFAPAYRALASFADAAGDHARAYRALQMMEIWGFTEAEDRPSLARLSVRAPKPPVRRLQVDKRRTAVLPAPARASLTEWIGPWAEHWPLLQTDVRIGGPLRAPASSSPVASVIASVGLLVGTSPEVFFADQVEEVVLALVHPRPMVILDATLENESEGTLRFLLGAAFDAVMHRYAPLLYLTTRQRDELLSTIRDLMLAPDARKSNTDVLAAALPKRMQTLLQEPLEHLAELPTWFASVVATSRRMGLVACADLVAAQRGCVRLAHEDGADAPMSLGEDLVLYALSAEYSSLHRDLARI